MKRYFTSLFTPLAFCDLHRTDGNFQLLGPVRKCKERDSGGSPSNYCHIHDCLQKFMETEELADSERFFCNTCKSKQPSTKKFMIRRLPNVLCLHIKRFRWTAYARKVLIAVFALKSYFTRLLSLRKG